MSDGYKVQKAETLVSRRITDIEGLFTTHFGKRYQAYREKWQKGSRMEPIDFPAHIDFELVDDCNLRCIMCPRNDVIKEATGLESLGSKTVLSFETFKRVIDEGKRYGLTAVDFGQGAEALILKNIGDYVRYARDAGFIDIRLTTNGQYLTEHKSEELIDAGLRYLAVSLDAIRPETYAQIRLDHKHRATRDLMLSVNNLERFLEIRRRKGSPFPVVRVSFAVMAENETEQEEFFDYWKDKVDFVDFQFLVDFTVRDRPNDFVCNEPFRRVAVWADGTVAPCCSFLGKKLPMGDANSKSIKEIWDGELFKQFRTNDLAKNHPEPCQQCKASRSLSGHVIREPSCSDQPTPIMPTRNVV
jgi:radical SAM protein with 4Fe4S-binding SPASM domain